MSTPNNPEKKSKKKLYIGIAAAVAALIGIGAMTDGDTETNEASETTDTQATQEETQNAPTKEETQEEPAKGKKCIDVPQDVKDRILNPQFQKSEFAVEEWAAHQGENVAYIAANGTDTVTGDEIELNWAATDLNNGGGGIKATDNVTALLSDFQIQEELMNSDGFKTARDCL